MLNFAAHTNRTGMLNFNFLRNKSFAIDLGNNNTLLTDHERVLSSQPSYIAFDSATHSVKAVGDAAYNMIEKNHAELQPVKPMKGGVIADFESASAMVKQMVLGLYPRRNYFSGFDRIVSGVPFSTTEVERRALRDMLDQFGASRTYLLFEPIAAALGMGLNIREPEGKMIVDIGGGITEIVIISLSGVAVFKSVKIAGDTFDRDIQDYVRKHYNLIIGTKTAEQIKLQIGSVLESDEPEMLTVRVKGKDVKEGIPVSREVTSREITQALRISFESIERCIMQALETCPPELAADIYLNGIYVTGGGALLRGVKARLEKTLMIPVHIDEEPLLSVSKGASIVLRDSKKFKNILME